MEQLSLVAPAMVGLAVAILSLAYAHRIARHRPKANVRHASAEEPPLPFEFTPPTISAESEGTITARTPERIH